MTEKEVGEIRRRFRAEKSNISLVRGCLVNEKREIVSQFSQSLGIMSLDESEELLAILKKTLSGTLGKNLLDVEFSTEQVVDSDEHRLLSALRNSALTDENAVLEMFSRIAQNLAFDGSYLILLVCDKYDVFGYQKDGKREEESSSVFNYILCSICPVKTTKAALSFHASDNAFRSIAPNSVVGSPEIGFLFPSFDDRTANIYDTLYYTKDIALIHEEFIENVLNCEKPMPATVQKETFGSILSDAVSDECSFEVVQTLNDTVNEMIDEHKASHESEPLMLSKSTVRDVLKACGVKEEKVDAFEEKYTEQFGQYAEIPPQNVLDTKKIEVKTADVVIKVNPERGDLVETRVIDGTKYIMIRAEDNVEVNGVNIHIS